MTATKKTATKKESNRNGGAHSAKTHSLMVDGHSWDRHLVMGILCEAIATSSISIATILRNGHNGETLPDYKTISRWLVEDETLRQQYARAKEDQADYLSEEMLEICDDASNDYMERTGKDGETPGYALNGEHVQRSRLRVDTRKWLASKLKPKKYGDKIDLNHGGQENNPVKITHDISQEAAANAYKDLLG